MIRGRVAIALSLIAGLAVVAAVGLVWLDRHPSGREKIPEARSDDPRVMYDGPYRNVRPDVKYVGDAACASCHRDKAEAFRHSAMGRSLRPIAQLAPEQRYGADVHNPFDVFACRFRVDRDGERVWHRQVLTDAEGQRLISNDIEVLYAIGSGHRGHSYLTAVDGFAFQTPVSWYAQKGIWDASPGFASGTRRPIVPDCLFCHSNRVEPVEHTINRYEEPIFRGHAIGCERCHGPGELHVASADPLDIVNPRRLPPAVREDVCQQCHIEGEGRVLRPGRHAWDFRPGLPLREYWAVFVPAEEPTGGLQSPSQPAVSQVEQMYASRCFQASGGTMGCIDCHDAHRHIGPQKREGFFRKKCLACHDQRGCSAPLAVRREKKDNCIDCHMPRLPTADIVHTAMSDHRIPRAPKKGQTPFSERVRSPTLFGAPLRQFRAAELSAEQLRTPRELGLVLVQLARDKAKFSEELPLAVRLIERALVDYPHDLALWEHKGTALLLRKERLPQALAAFETILQLCPDHEVALSQAAFINQLMEKYEEALPYWRRTVAVSPQMENYRFNLAMTLTRLSRWQEALDQCREAVRLDPFSGRNRVLLAVCLHHCGDKEKAGEEFEKVRALKLPDFDVLRQQFDEETR